MTCLEKMKQEHPGDVDESFFGGAYGCPSRHGYMENPSWCPGHGDKNICARCWNREIPETENEAVNHPAHYQGKHECIDEMIALFGVEAVKHFCKCNVYKYRFRANQKNGLEDIQKAEWYMDKLMELEKATNDD